MDGGCSNVSDTAVVLIPRDCDNLILYLLITIVMQMSFYLIACTCKFDTVTDFAGGSNFTLVALLSFAFSGTYNLRQIVTTVLVILWSFRLSGYLFYRILKTKTDARFDKLRENPLKFLVFWILQILWVYIVSMTVMLINSPSANEFSYDDFDPRDLTLIFGALLFLYGLVIETVADQSKFNFRNNPDNKGKWCNVGLWKVTRHPNYYGELSVWWAVFVISTPILTTWKWIAIISPLFISLLLIFGSGIPTVERKADKKYGRDPAYREYKKSTPPLIPFIPALYRLMNKWIKMIFCCEYPFYTVDTDEQDEKRSVVETKGEQV